MIVEMARLRILGPRDRQEETLALLQDLGVVHLEAGEPLPPYEPRRPTEEEEGRRRRLLAVLGDVEWVLERLPGGPGAGDDGEGGMPACPPRPLPARHRRAGREAPERRRRLERWRRLARRARRALRTLERRADRLREELETARRFDAFLEVFRELGALPLSRQTGLRRWYLILRGGDPSVADRLREAMTVALGEAFHLLTRRTATGEIAAVLLVPRHRAEAVEGILAGAGVEELELPGGDGETTPEEAIVSLRARIDRLGERLRDVEARRGRHRPALRRCLRTARAELHDRLLKMEAAERGLVSRRAFVLLGWVPASDVDRVLRALRRGADGTVVVEELARESWRRGEAPVALTNPRIFRPFETVTRLLPLPRYGSIDPTPFVAVFFPMFFGVILGDVAYGLALAALAVVLRRRSQPESPLRAVSEVAGACALFTVVFGLLYGELLGDLGRRWLGLGPLAMDREEALVPFLVFALALGVVHVVLGLVLGAVASARSDPRRAVGRGTSALMIVLVLLALLAAVDVLPSPFFTPAVVALLVAFPLLVVAEGFLAPLELISALGNILSYARIMALGTASVVMAVMANRLAGTAGGVLVGLLFGLLFHLVNFALGVFGPTVHGLRLQYVEFFGQFFSPGGVRYRPLRHWADGPVGGPVHGSG